jgi:hypothetical protein
VYVARLRQQERLIKSAKPESRAELVNAFLSRYRLFFPVNVDTLPNQLKYNIAIRQIRFYTVRLLIVAGLTFSSALLLTAAALASIYAPSVEGVQGEILKDNRISGRARADLRQHLGTGVFREDEVEYEVAKYLFGGRRSAFETLITKHVPREGWNDDEWSALMHAATTTEDKICGSTLTYYRMRLWTMIACYRPRLVDVLRNSVRLKRFAIRMLPQGEVSPAVVADLRDAFFEPWYKLAKAQQTVPIGDDILRQVVDRQSTDGKLDLGVALGVGILIDIAVGTTVAHDSNSIRRDFYIASLKLSITKHDVVRNSNKSVVLHAESINYQQNPDAAIADAANVVKPKLAPAAQQLAAQD